MIGKRIVIEVVLEGYPQRVPVDGYELSLPWYRDISFALVRKQAILKDRRFTKKYRKQQVTAALLSTPTFIPRNPARWVVVETTSGRALNQRRVIGSSRKAATQRAREWLKERGERFGGPKGIKEVMKNAIAANRSSVTLPKGGI